MTDQELKQKSIIYRKKILTYIKQANAGHTGGSLSCVDILNVLYNRILNVTPENFYDLKRDHYIQSKGHSVEALYVVLADKGFFPESDLETLCQHGSRYVGHPTRKVKGIEHNTGALGHGLSYGVGVALAGKMDNKVFVLLGDGELAEGSNWEALLTASHYQLDNLCAIVDLNRLQITDWTRNVCCTDPLDEKFKAFGWSVQHVDGHDVKALTKVLSSVPFEKGKPSMIIANTVKGKGVSFIENNYKWHHHVPTDEEYKKAMKELNQALQKLNNEKENN
ncbi:transketolase [candidate division KSB1 bacterium]|nr:transketolase [candidate division KSB1 bacterium]